MPENDCPINGVNCVSIARVEALERALEAQKQHSSLAREKIYDRLGELERGMATVTHTVRQYHRPAVLNVGGPERPEREAVQAVGDGRGGYHYGRDRVSSG